MDKEIEVINIFIESHGIYVTTFVYTQDDGSYEAVTIINPKDIGGKTITIGFDKEDLLKRHAGAVGLEIEIQKSKNGMTFKR
ncbi:MAG: hypothetical protein HYW27_02420 [Candidatus Aenigmarchaeota archaeon]|nr:hypothetical protein [Candidatus Aenigmarchaeota archaeon]